MALILLPKRFHPDFKLPKQKPLCPVEIDWTSKFSKDLDVYTLAQSGGAMVDMTNHITHTVPNGGSVTPGGIGCQFLDQAGSSIELTNTFGDEPVNNAVTFCCFLRWEPTGGTGNQFVMYRDSPGTNFSVGFAHLAGGLRYGFSGSSSTSAANRSVGTSVDTANFKAGQLVLLSVTATNTSLELYVDGILVDSIAFAASNLNWNNNENWYLGGGEGDLNNVDGTIMFAAVWHRSFYAGEHIEFYRNMYDLLKPKTSPGYFTPDAGGGITLTVQDITSAQTLSEPNLTQQNILSVNSLSLAQSISQPSLTQANILSVDSITSGQTIENVSLTVAAALSVQNITNDQTLQNVELIQQAILAVNNINSDQTLSNITLTTGDQLIVQDILNTQTISSPTLTAHALLLVDQITNTQFIGVVNLGGEQEIGIITVAFKDSTPVVFKDEEISVKYTIATLTVKFKD